MSDKSAPTACRLGQCRARYHALVIIAVVLTAGKASGECLQDAVEVTGGDVEPNYKSGFDVAVADNTVVIGTPGHGGKGNNAGAAYVLRRTSGEWFEEARLLAPDGLAGDFFGASVSVSGNVVVIGAYGHDDPVAGGGAAYVFRFDGDAWHWEQKLVAPDVASGDAFGKAVAVFGDTIVVGAREHSGPAYRSGAAYVYRFDGREWYLDDTLFPSDVMAGDRFGTSVAATDGRIIAGADSEDTFGTNSGAAYVFVETRNGWVEEAKLLAGDGNGLDLFGTSVSIDRDVAIVGAYMNDERGDAAGAAYVFRYNGSRWVEEQKLLASGVSTYDYFGYDVAVSGSVAVVGAYWDDPAGDAGMYDSGTAYRFDFDGTRWVEGDRLQPLFPSADQWFGYAVAVNGDTTAVGVVQSNEFGYRAGAVQIAESSCVDPPGCTTHTDCNDDDMCTTDRCVDGTCVNQTGAAYTFVTSDVADLVACISGPRQLFPDPCCQRFDANGDRHVDMQDFDQLQDMFTAE